MKPTIPILLAATLCASALVTPAARAQDAYAYYNTPQAWTDYGQTQMWTNDQFYSQQNYYNSIYASQSATSNTGSKTSRKVRKTKRKPRVTTTYRESPAVHKQILGKFMRHLRTRITSKTDADNLCRDFGSQDVMAAWAKEEAREGLKRGDVADAMAFYWVTDWQIANRVTTDPTRAQVRAVRRLFVSILSSTPAFAKATSAQRQEMAEGYIYTAVLQGALFAQVFHTGDKALIQKVSDGQATQFKKETGLDLRQMKLTNTGFAAKS